MPPSPGVSARDQRILAGYRAGATMIDLANAEEERGVKRTRTEVVSLVNAQRPKTAGEKPRTTPTSKLPADLQAEVVRRYGNGESGVQIARALGLPSSSVY